MIDVLVWSSRPLLNKMIAVGREARVANQRVTRMRAEYQRRRTLPLPEGTRERGWAVDNRARYLAEVENVANEAAALTRYWATLEDKVTDKVIAGDIPPEVAFAAEAAIWGPEEIDAPEVQVSGY